MAFSCGFYNAKDHDRQYEARQFGHMFDGLINDGIYSTIGGCMMVRPGGGMSVLVQSGRAWFNLTWSYNSDDYPLDLEVSDLLLPRIDAIVLEIDSRVQTRDNCFKVITGTPQTQPERPDLISNSDDGIWQYPLAYVTVKANTETIDKADIENMVGRAPCPFVTGILETADITALWEQWEGRFEDWFENVKTTLGEDTAGALLYQVEQRVKYSEKATVDEAKGGTNNTHWMTPLLVKEAVVKNRIQPGEIIYSDTTLNESDGFYKCNNTGFDQTRTKKDKFIKAFGYKYGPIGGDWAAFGPPSLNQEMSNSLYCDTGNSDVPWAYNADLILYNGPYTATLTANNLTVSDTTGSFTHTTPKIHRLIGFVNRGTYGRYIVGIGGAAFVIIRITDGSTAIAQRITVRSVTGSFTLISSFDNRTPIGFVLGNYAYCSTASGNCFFTNIVSNDDVHVYSEAPQAIKSFLSWKYSLASNFGHRFLCGSYGNIIVVPNCQINAACAISASNGCVPAAKLSIDSSTGAPVYSTVMTSFGASGFSTSLSTHSSMSNSIGFQYSVYDDGKFWEACAVAVADFEARANYGGYVLPEEGTWDNTNIEFPSYTSSYAFLYNIAIKSRLVSFSGGCYNNHIFLYPTSIVNVLDDNRYVCVNSKSGYSVSNPVTGSIILRVSQYNYPGNKQNLVLYPTSVPFYAYRYVMIKAGDRGYVDNIGSTYPTLFNESIPYPGALPTVLGRNDAYIYLPNS